MSLLVQDYLATHTFGQLFEEHGVEVSFHSMGYKCSLNYSQLEARDDNPLAQECRGLILATNDGHSLNVDAEIVNGRFNFDKVCPGRMIVLGFPMKRFFNEGQGAAAEIDWSDPNLHIQEKKDGSLAILYLDTISRKWCMATRSVPEADLPGQDGRTFRQLFEKALEEHLKLSWEDFTAKLDPNLTYAFELCTPYNQIVVRHNTCRIYFLTARDMRTLQELPSDDSRFDEFPKPKFFSLATLESIVEYVNAQSPMEQEGVVVKDIKLDATGSFPRLKIKHPDHGLYSRAREMLGSSDRNCLGLILSGKEDDLLPVVPYETAAKILSIKEGYVGWLKHQEDDYQAILAEATAIDPSKKTFALKVKERAVSYPPPYFALWDKKVASFNDWVMNARKEGSWSNAFLDRLLEEIRRPVSLPVEVKQAMEEVKRMRAG
jgi:hypothetical protein